MMGYVIGAFATVVSGLSLFIIQQLLQDNKRLRKSRKDENIMKESAMEEGMTALLRVQLIEYHEKYMARQSIPNYAYENWTKLFKAYRDLGGNGMLLHMDEDIKELEMKNERARN